MQTVSRAAFRWVMGITALVCASVGSASAQQQVRIERSRLPPGVTAAILRSEARVVETHVEAPPAHADSATVQPPPPAHTDSAPAHHVPSQVVTRAIPAAGDAVTFRRGEFIAARVGNAATVVTKPKPAAPGASASVDSFVALPERIVGVAANSELAILRPAFLPQGELRYVAKSQLFQGNFGIGLEDSIHSTERRDLSGAFHFQFGGGADSLAPGELDVSHTNLPLAPVRVVARDPADSVMIRIVTAADMRGTEVWLRARPALAMGLVPEHAQGLGLQRIPISVAVLGTRRTTPIAVKLSADRGTVEPDTLLLGPGTLATVYWRTEGLGDARILAHATGVDDAGATVDFAFPLVFLVAALLGGAVGAALKAVREPNPTTRGVVTAIAIGMLGGVASAVVYYAIGVSLFQVPVNVPFFNEAAVFALGVLAGLLGVRLAGTGQSGQP